MSAITVIDQLGVWGVVAGVLLALIVPRLPAAVRPIVSAIAARLTAKPTPAPIAPAESPDGTLLLLFRAIAKRRFPWLDDREAMFRYASEVYAPPASVPAATPVDTPTA